MSVDLRRQLQRAIERRDVEATVEFARALRPLDLLDALDVLTLLAETGDRRFQPWARRWVARVVESRRPEPATITSIERLLRQLPTQNDARGVTVTLRSYARPPRTWS